MSWTYAKSAAVACALSCLLWAAAASAQETNPFGDAPKPAAPAEAEPPAAAAPAEPAAPAESAPATPPGAKPMDVYRAQLRQFSAQRDHQKVLDLCDEIAKIYPNEDVKYYRTRAEQSIKDDANRKTRHFAPIKDPSSESPAAGTAAPPTGDTPSETAPPAEPREASPPAEPAAVAPRPADPEPPSPSSSDAGSGKTILAIILVVAGLGIIGAVVMMGMKKKSAAKAPSRGAANHGRRANDYDDSASAGSAQPSGFDLQPVSYGAQPDVFGLGSSSSPAIPASAARDFASPSPGGGDDDIFGSFDSPAAESPATKTASAKSGGGFSESDIFDVGDLGLGSQSAPARPAEPLAPPPPAPKPAPAAAQKEDSDLFALFEGVYEPPKKSAPAAPPKPQHAPEISFDFGSPSPASSAPKPETPWAAPEGSEDIPALPIEALGGMPSAPTGASPWDTGSKTKTHQAKPAAPPPSSIDDDFSSLPLLADSPSPSFTMSRPEAAVTQGFGATSSKPAPKFPEPPPAADKPAPAFAEMSLKSLRGPESSETIGAFEPISFGGDTNPGFEMPAPGKPAAKEPPPLKFGEGDEINFPALDASAIPEMPFEKTMRMSARELAEDPDLILESPSHEGKPGVGAPGLDKLKLFKADETVSVDLADSSSGLFTPGTFGSAPKPAARPVAHAPSAPPVDTPGDSYDQERELGMNAFRDAEWEKAVYHLSIAAALRPDATDIKEHLRRARRLRKEKEG